MAVAKQNKCRECGATMLVEVVNHRYIESGLANVMLVGVRRYRCKECSAVELSIPRIIELHSVIAGAIIRQNTRLDGREIAFLRHYLGWTGTDMAEHMGVDSTTVSAWENERKPFGTTSDRLLRLIIANYSKAYDYSLDALTMIADEPQPPVSMSVSPRADGWQVGAP